MKVKIDEKHSYILIIYIMINSTNLCQKYSIRNKIDQDLLLKAQSCFQDLVTACHQKQTTLTLVPLCWLKSSFCRLGIEHTILGNSKKWLFDRFRSSRHAINPTSSGMSLSILSEMSSICSLINEHSSTGNTPTSFFFMLKNNKLVSWEISPGIDIITLLLRSNVTKETILQTACGKSLNRLLFRVRCCIFFKAPSSSGILMREFPSKCNIWGIKNLLKV